MRISDWSSDVCSSDLLQTSETFDRAADARQFAKWLDALGAQGALDQLDAIAQRAVVPTLDQLAADHIEHRSEARRVGKECGRTCSSRRSQQHYKKKTDMT